MNPTPLRIGVIGCGAYGRRHIKRLQELPDVVVTALADTSTASLEQARALATRADVFATDDYRRLLERPLDAVVIASPDSHHVRQVLDALEAGLHVLCEKPLTRSPSELQAVIDARRRTDRIVAMTYQRRYDGAHRRMRDEILSGRWGKVTAVSVYNCEDWITPNVGTWRHDPELCPGGFFYDASGHQLDMVFWATRLEPLRVAARADRAGTAVPIRVWGVAQLSGGVPMSFSFVGDAHAWREQVNIHCEGMDFLIQNFRPAWIVDGKPTDILPDRPTEGADAEFLQMIRSDTPNPAPPEDLWPVLRFTNAALASTEHERLTEAAV